MTEYYALYVDGNRDVIRDILKEDTVSDSIEGYQVYQKYSREVTLEEYASANLQALYPGECLILKKIGSHAFESTGVIASMDDNLIDIHNLFPKSRGIVSRLIDDLKDKGVVGNNENPTYSWRYGRIYVTLIERHHDIKHADAIVIKNGDSILANIYRVGESILIEEFKENCGVFDYLVETSNMDSLLPTHEEMFKFIEHQLGNDIKLPGDEDAAYIITKHLKEMGCDNADKVCKELKRLREISNSNDFAIIAHDIQEGKSKKTESGFMKAINAMVGK